MHFVREHNNFLAHCHAIIHLYSLSFSIDHPKLDAEVPSVDYHHMRERWYESDVLL